MNVNFVNKSMRGLLDCQVNYALSKLGIEGSYFRKDCGNERDFLNTSQCKYNHFSFSVGPNALQHNLEIGPRTD